MFNLVRRRLSGIAIRYADIQKDVPLPLFFPGLSDGRHNSNLKG
jgi:hypothetical protein